MSVPVRATLRQDCDESRLLRADKLLIRPTHGDWAGAGSDSGQVPFKAPLRADQFSGHTVTTSNSLRLRIAEPVDPRLTVSFQAVLTPLGHGRLSPTQRSDQHRKAHSFAHGTTVRIQEAAEHRPTRVYVTTATRRGAGQDAYITPASTPRSAGPRPLIRPDARTQAEYGGPGETSARCSKLGFDDLVLRERLRGVAVGYTRVG